MTRKTLSLLISTLLTISISMPILASPLDQQLNNQKQQLMKQQDSYTEIQKDFENLQISIELLDFDIENIYAEIDKAKIEIKDTEVKIEQTTKEIVVAQSNIKDEEDLFNERMRVMFMNGADTYLEIVLNSKGLDDFVSRVENVKKIVEYDNHLISELDHKKQDIEQRKKYLSESKTKIVTLQDNNQAKLDKLSIEKQKQGTLIVESQKQQKLHKDEIAETQILMGSTISQITDAANAANQANEARKYEISMATKKIEQANASRGITSNLVKNETKVETKYEPEKEVVKEVSEPPKVSSGSSYDVVAYAQNFLGTPYEWAATGPTTFDCSGFVQYVYAKFGVSTGRSTYDQITHGDYVAREDLQPGDLVFFGSGSPHHVGIYVGNNAYIHAPSTGDVVKISALTRSDYLSARRVK